MVRTLLLLMLLIFLQSGKFAGSAVYVIENGVINFHSDAPLELISGTSKELRGRLDTDKKMFAFAIKINSFTGFNNPLQKEHFNENYLESDQYPFASFSGKIIEDIDLTLPGSYSVRAKGNFTVHGVARERIIKCELEVKEGKISVRSNFTVLLADHNIAIPKIVYEKLASEIKVEVKADLTSQ